MNYFQKIRKIKGILLLSLLFLQIAPVKSQELDPIVDVDLSSINIDVRDRLSNFKQDVQNYLQKTKFTDEVIVNDVRGKPYKIKCNFQFFITAALSYETYSAQVVVVVQRNIYKTQNFTPIFRVKDENWDFNYIKGQGFYHDDLKYNSLTSFLDYYAYMIIGADDDSWEPDLGTPRYQKAQNLVNLAIANGQNKGWIDNSLLKSSRNSYPLELLNSKYDDFRKAFWIYHFAGIDSIQYNKRQALDRISQAIILIGKVKKNEIKSFSIKAFFDAKYMEIASALVDYYDKTIYRKLMDIDPDHAATYEEYARK